MMQIYYWMDSKIVLDDAIGAEVGWLVGASLAQNTKDTYTTGLNSFQNFRQEYCLEMVWPPPPSYIILFIAYMSLKGKAYKTDSCYVAATGFSCRVMNCISVCDYSNNFVVKKC